jgi:fucose permease
MPATARTPSHGMRSRSIWLLGGLAYLGFVSIGLPDGLLGVAWPSMRASFGLPIDALGGLLVAYTLGYLVSSFWSGHALSRVGVGSLLALSCLATSASLTGYALAPAWSLVVGLGAVAGLGAGAIDAGLNTFAATRFSARAVTWLHASWGVGATLGPLLMTSVLEAGRSWRVGYAVVGALQLALAAAFAATRRVWTAPNGGDAPETLRAPARATLRRPAALAGIGMFFLYTGLEAAAGAWSYSLFSEARGVDPMKAGVWVGVYFGCLTAGRVAAGFAAGRVRPRRLLRACMVGLVLGAALVWSDVTDGVSFAGLALLGLSAAPVFPTLIAATPARLDASHTANAIGFQIAAAVLGQSLVPTLVGIASHRFGLEAIGVSLVVVAILLVVVFEIDGALERSATASRRSDPPADTMPF